jgi:hypothetical protein
MALGIGFGAVLAAEAATVAGCSLWPLRSQLGLLDRAAGWARLCSFSAGNLVSRAGVACR